MSARGQMLIMVPRGTLAKLQPVLSQKQQTNAAGAAAQR
jgi:hypothetical protein